MDSHFIPPKNKDDLTPYLASIIKNKRVNVFVDSANLYHAANIAKLNIHYPQIVRWFKSRCKLNQVNFYTAYDPEDPKQIDFMEELEEAGFRVVKKPIKVYANSIKGNMDIELTVDAMQDLGGYDILVLISGDGDFHYLVKALEDAKKKTVIISVGGFTSYELHQEADSYFFFNRIHSVWKQDKRKGRKKTKNVGIEKLEKITPEALIITPDNENREEIEPKKDPLKNKKVKNYSKNNKNGKPKVKLKMKKTKLFPSA